LRFRELLAFLRFCFHVIRLLRCCGTVAGAFETSEAKKLFDASSDFRSFSFDPLSLPLYSFTRFHLACTSLNGLSILRQPTRDPSSTLRRRAQLHQLDFFRPDFRVHRTMKETEELHRATDTVGKYPSPTGRSSQA
jgi:hypothetical protein